MYFFTDHSKHILLLNVSQPDTQQIKICCSHVRITIRNMEWKYSRRILQVQNLQFLQGEINV